MKYLIDGVNKSVLSLANQWKYLKNEDEYRVYDPAWSNIDGLDIVDSNNYKINVDGGDRIKIDDVNDNIDDTRRFKIVTDFDSALEWCDCYVTFRSIPYELTVNMDTTYITDSINSMLERIEKAKSTDKYIYLGNRFSDEFVDIMDNYDKCINKVITKKDLETLDDNSYFYKEVGAYLGFRTTMIIGTNSSSGKFSCALKAKRYYEDQGEKVLLIHTEETYPFLDDQDGTIYGFCRNFSEMTTDEDFNYLQAMIAKLYEEKRPNRIIFVTQSGFGLDGIINSYQDTNNGMKMKGLWDAFIYRSFGVNDVIVSSNANRLDIAKRIVDYFNIHLSNIKVDGLYINPRPYAEDDIIVYTSDDKSTFYKIIPKINIDDLEVKANGLALEYPWLNINCEYGNITDKVNAFKGSDTFKDNSAKLYAYMMLRNINEKYSFTKDDIVNLINDNYGKFEISEEQFEKIKAEL